MNTRNTASPATRRLLAIMLTSMPFVSHAADIYKANNTTSMNNASSFVTTSGGSTAPAAIPAAADRVIFDSTILGPITFNQGASTGTNQSWASILFTNPAGNVTINQNGTNNTLTLNTAGIDMSNATADLTFNSGIIRAANNNFGLTFNVASGRTLTMNSVTNQGNTKTATFNGPGNIILNGASGSGGAMKFSITGGANVTLNSTGSWAANSEVINGTLNVGADNSLGSGNLNLGGTNASTPTITAFGGSRVIANNVTLLATSVAGNPTIAGTNDLTINGLVTNSGASRTLTVNNSGNTTLGTGGIALSEGATSRVLTINGSGNVTVSGVIANGSTSTASGLTYSGNGTLSLANANTFAGTLTASSGTIRIDHANAAQNATVSVGAANVLAFGSGITSATFAGLAGSGDLALTNVASTAVSLTVGNNNATSSYAGTFSGLGNIAKIGTGTLTLSGNNSNYNGGITVNAGTLSVASVFGAGNSSATITAANGTTVNASSALGGSNVAAGITLSGVGANATLTNGHASGGFAGNFSGSADQTLTISNSGGQNVNTNASTKQFQNFNGKVLVLSGSALVNRNTAVNWTNGGDNTLFEVNGTLSSRNAGTWALGALSGSGTLSMGTGGSNNIGFTYIIGARGTDTTFSGQIQDGDSATGKLVNMTKVGNATLNLSGNNTYTGATIVSNGTLRVDGTLASGSNVTVNSGARLSGNGTIGGNTTLNSATIGSLGDTLTLSNNLTTNGASELASGATVNVNGATNVASGTFTISGTLGGSGIWSVASGATLAGTATLNNAATVNGGTLGSSGNTLTLGNTLTTNGGSIASGSTVNVTGATTFASGTFTVNGTLGGAGTKTVSAGATLNGSGTIIGNTTINGNLAPGNSPGVLTFSGDLTFTNTTVTTMELAGTGGVAGTDFDQTVVTGTLTFDGALNIVSYLSFSIDQPGTYDLFAAATSGNFDSVSVGSTALTDPSLSGLWTANNVDNTYLYTFNASTGDFSVQAIPEPSAYAALAGLGMIGFALTRRRRKSKQAA